MKLKSTLTGLGLLLCGSAMQGAVPAMNVSDLSLGAAPQRMKADKSVKNILSAAPQAPGEELPYFITSVPSTAEKVLYSRDWHGFFVLNYLISMIIQGEENERVQYLYFDGDDVYFPTPVLSFEAPSYIKGTKTETGISFPLPQCVCSRVISPRIRWGLKGFGTSLTSGTASTISKSRWAEFMALVYQRIILDINSRGPFSWPT